MANKLAEGLQDVSRSSAQIADTSLALQRISDNRSATEQRLELTRQQLKEAKLKQAFGMVDRGMKFENGAQRAGFFKLSGNMISNLLKGTDFEGMDVNAFANPAGPAVYNALDQLFSPVASTEPGQGPDLDALRVLYPADPTGEKIQRAVEAAVNLGKRAQQSKFSGKDIQGNPLSGAGGAEAFKEQSAVQGFQAGAPGGTPTVQLEPDKARSPEDRRRQWAIGLVKQAAPTLSGQDFEAKVNEVLNLAQGGQIAPGKASPGAATGANATMFPKAVPPKVAETIQGYTNSLRNYKVIDSELTNLVDQGGDIGPVAGRLQNFAASVLGVADDQFVKLRTKAGMTARQEIKDSSGLAYTDRDFENIIKNIPTEKDTPDIARSKIRALSAIKGVALINTLRGAASQGNYVKPVIRENASLIAPTLDVSTGGVTIDDVKRLADLLGDDEEAVREFVGALPLATKKALAGKGKK